MTITLTPIEPEALQFGVVRPGESTYLGCPVAEKTRVVTIPKGTAQQVCWDIRNRGGKPIDLTDLLMTTSPAPTGNQILFRFNNILSGTTEIHQIVGSTTLKSSTNVVGIILCPETAAPNPSIGEVCAVLTDAIINKAGIWQVDIGITDTDGNLRVVDKGYLSVERTLFGDIDSLSCFPTISEIRVRLRDTVVENDLHDEYEFDDMEIIEALLRPVQQWNETPPNVAHYDASNFPWTYHWTNATVCELLKTAAHWYRRNKLKASHGGITVDDKSKDVEYLAVARAMQEEWMEWMLRKKIEINLSLASGSVGSPYGY